MTSSKPTQAPRHKEGSRKAKVHDLFDAEGQDAAWTRGLKLKLSPNTLRSWFATWRRDAQPVKKRPAKKTAPKTSKAQTPSVPEPVESIPVFLNG